MNSLHKLRGGDGPGVPADPPPSRWPDLVDITDYWESFTYFARSELEQPTVTFEVKNNGKWRFIAKDRPNREIDTRRQSLTYDPEENTIRFHDPEVDSGWVMEDAFGGDPTGASSAL